MNKRLCILFLLLISFFSCKSVRKIRIHSKVNSPGIIYLKSEFDPEIKINGKYLASGDATDATDDTAISETSGVDAESLTESKTKDSTSDSVDLYIRDPERIKFYRNYERLFNEYILDNLAGSLNTENMAIEVYNYDFMKDKATNFYIILTLQMYNEGEYNMIENIDTRMNMIINCYEGPRLVAELQKSYVIKTGIGYPLERQRLNQLSMDVVNDLIKMFKKKLFYKKKKNNKKTNS